MVSGCKSDHFEMKVFISLLKIGYPLRTEFALLGANSFL